MLIERLVRAPRATIGKPLETLGFEATIPLFVGVLIAWVLLARAPDLAIPVFAAIVARAISSSGRCMARSPIGRSAVRAC